jgi:hypothetical protein
MERDIQPEQTLGGILDVLRSVQELMDSGRIHQARDELRVLDGRIRKSIQKYKVVRMRSARPDNV